MWKGNRKFENDAERSLPSLAALAPLAALPGVQWISLQKGAGQAEARAADAPLPPPVHAAGRASTPHIALFHARGPPAA